MIREGEYIYCEGKRYCIRKAVKGKTCSICGCGPCRDNGRCYSATCYKLIGNNCFLRYDGRADRED